MISVVGVGADGWDGLSGRAKRAIGEAEVLYGSARQLGLVESTAERVEWPTPLLPQLPTLLDRYEDKRRCVLASGDPMFHGIGVILSRIVGIGNLDVIPSPSSASLACARLGWSLAATRVISLVTDPVETLLPELADRRRLLVLSRNQYTPAWVAGLLNDNGFGASQMFVLGQLGGPEETMTIGTAARWTTEEADPLNVIAIECSGTGGQSRVPGLPDHLFGTHGQFTKQEIRALTVSALAPRPTQLLWDVGGGSGSIAIEWLRAERTCSAVAFEQDAGRALLIPHNAQRLGVPRIVVRGKAPNSFLDAPDPDAIFLGGGLTQPGMFEAAWERLKPGGRFVANAVTAETEAQIMSWSSKYGGQLRRFQIYRGEPLGGFTAFRPMLPVTQWIVTK
ncbi:precorrin-6y C5,15-methyltransferase (decarboxylating) subunit CbiE [Smaragdicoccus niigatensis]|uniref:precorrin-6y C5,15-methyltransferase (decarboxylating) subunit CbiE n=1 Tax=Smaragdicoccus niigatensis TaxID=359359 RepID=UPI00036B9AFB|nr:precorrin-6y C5,15-methyltransferase (decarboxylating) subunit CbiE [Smaragdicoccus niigatensis]